MSWCHYALYYSEKERLKYSFYWFPTKFFYIKERDYFLITIYFRETSTKKLHNFIWRLMVTLQPVSGFQEYDEENFALRKTVSIWIVISRSNLQDGNSHLELKRGWAVTMEMEMSSSYLSRLLRHSLRIRSHFVTGVVGHFGDGLFENRGGLSDG